MRQRQPIVRQTGFSMMEMLLALTLMGVLASLIVPIVNNQVGEQKLTGMAKDSANQILQAFTKLSSNALVGSSTTTNNIVFYMNTVRTITDSTLYTNLQWVGVPGQTPSNMPPTDPLNQGIAKNYDLTPATTTTASASNGSSLQYYTGVITYCTTTTPCVMLQDGSILQYTSGASFGPAQPVLNRNALLFIWDPDGPGIQPAVSFVLTESGRVTTISSAYGNYDPGGTLNVVFTSDLLPHGYGFNDPGTPSVPGLGSTTDPDYILPWTNG